MIPLEDLTDGDKDKDEDDDEDDDEDKKDSLWCPCDPSDLHGVGEVKES